MSVVAWRGIDGVLLPKVSSEPHYPCGFKSVAAEGSSGASSAYGRDLDRPLLSDRGRRVAILSVT